MKKLNNLRKPGASASVNMLVRFWSRRLKEHEAHIEALQSSMSKQETQALIDAVLAIAHSPRRAGKTMLMTALLEELDAQGKVKRQLILDSFMNTYGNKPLDFSLSSYRQMTGRTASSEPASGLDQLNDLQPRSRLFRGGARHEVKVVPFMTRPHQGKTSMFEKMWNDAHKDEPKFVALEMDYDKIEQRIVAQHLEGIPQPTGREAISDHPIWPEGTPMKNGRHELAGQKGKLCYRTVCQRPLAFWYNRSTQEYYCRDCAKDLNRVNRDMQYDDGRPLCIEEGPDHVDESAHEAHYLGLSGRGPDL